MQTTSRCNATKTRYYTSDGQNWECVVHPLTDAVIPAQDIHMRGRMLGCINRGRIDANQIASSLESDHDLGEKYFSNRWNEQLNLKNSISHSEFYITLWWGA